MSFSPPPRNMRVFGGKRSGSSIEAALQHELVRPEPADRPPVPVFRDGTGARPGVDLTSNRALSELLDEDGEVR